MRALVKLFKNSATALLASALLLGAPRADRAQELPDLGRQDAWGAADKKEFLRYLRSGQSAPITGDVRETASADKNPPLRKARYATLNLATDTLFTVSGSGSVHQQSTGVGPKLLLGGHLFSWVRYYAGVQYDELSQEKLDGSKAAISHWQAPLGLELALVPLGTPQTRYVLLRGGVALHHFTSAAVKSDFGSPILGWQGTWNAGIGYEWQFEDSRWRVHALAEGYRSLARRASASFFGLGFTTGLVYTF